MVDLDISVSSHLKEELTWASDKRLWVTTMYSYRIKELKETKE